MSRIDEMIAELSPAGVETKILGDIAQLVRGNGMPKSVLTDSGVGAIHYGQIYTKYGAWTDETLSFVSPETSKRLAKADPGDIIITNTSENLDDVGKAVAWLGDGQIVTGGHATIIKHTMEPKYLSYWLQSPAFFDQKRMLATGTKVIDVSANKLETVRIPVPPLEVQREIVRILDQFTQLEAELEAELEARRRQYDYHRHILLKLPSVPRVAVAELVGRVSSGRNKSRVEGAPYPVYGSTGQIGTTDKPAYEGEALLVARVGANAGRVNVVSGEYDVSDNTLILNPTSEWNVNFAFHQLAEINLNQYAVGGGQPLVTGKLLKTLEVALPSPKEQEEIALLLDKFDALVNGGDVGIPAEIAARRQQYSYYRNKLLTFKEAE